MFLNNLSHACAPIEFSLSPPLFSKELNKASEIRISRVKCSYFKKYGNVALDGVIRKYFGKERIVKQGDVIGVLVNGNLMVFLLRVEFEMYQCMYHGSRIKGEDDDVTVYFKVVFVDCGFGLVDRDTRIVQQGVVESRVPGREVKVNPGYEELFDSVLELVSKGKRVLLQGIGGVGKTSLLRNISNLLSLHFNKVFNFFFFSYFED